MIFLVTWHLLYVQSSQNRCYTCNFLVKLVFTQVFFIFRSSLLYLSSDFYFSEIRFFSHSSVKWKMETSDEFIQFYRSCDSFRLMCEWWHFKSMFLLGWSVCVSHLRWVWGQSVSRVWSSSPGSPSWWHHPCSDPGTRPGPTRAAGTTWTSRWHSSSRTPTPWTYTLLWTHPDTHTQNRWLNTWKSLCYM